MTRAYAGLAIIFSVFSACGGGGGGPPCVPTIDLSGIWSGTATGDDVARGEPGTIAATITQSACTLGGTWTVTFADASLDRQLEITGNSPQAASVVFDLKQCVGAGGSCDTVDTCDFLATGSLVSATEISGSYTTGVNCSFSESGSFDIALQSRLTPTPVPTITPTAVPIATLTPTP
jgi:hypothetical protein